jgi:hypothetical protein
MHGGLHPQTLVLLPMVVYVTVFHVGGYKWSMQQLVRRVVSCSAMSLALCMLIELRSTQENPGSAAEALKNSLSGMSPRSAWRTSRSVLGGILLLILGLGALYAGGGAMIAGLILAAIGIMLLIGWPAVTINTAGNDLRRMTGTIFSKSAAEAYVAAVRKALFAKP